MYVVYIHEFGNSLFQHLHVAVILRAQVQPQRQMERRLRIPADNDVAMKRGRIKMQRECVEKTTHKNPLNL